MKREKNFNQISFNPQQKKIIEQSLGACCVVAGAGTGKTKVLTSRICYVIEHFRINPNRILAITFTNKAANEIANRIKSIGVDQQFNWVNTFHAFARKFLCREIQNIGRNQKFSIIDEDDQLNIVKLIYKENNFDRLTLSYRTVVNIVNIQKNFDISIEEALNSFYNDKNYSTNCVEKLIIARQVSNLYEKYLVKNNLVDFSDLLILTHQVLANFSEVRKKWQNHFEYIFVDEFQDVNKIQYEIVLFLAQTKRNIFVVGDSDQSIYTWRGANQSIEQTFCKDFPEARVLLLEQNYRSSKSILDIANELIKNNKNRTDKKLFTSNTADEKVVYYSAFSQNDEAEWVAGKIVELVNQKQSFQFKDIAILYRSNYWSRAIEQALISAEIPYVIYGGIKFYQRKEIKDILAYIRTIIFQDDLSVLRIINVPSRKIGDKSLMIVKKFANDHAISVYDALIHHKKIEGLCTSVHNSIDNFLNDLKVIEEKSGLKFDQIIPTIVDVINYKDSLESNVKFRMENIEQLSQALVNFSINNPNGKIDDFLNEIALFTDHTSKSEDAGENVVKLMTIHTAKGLEFSCVFVIGLVDGVFPTSYSISLSDSLGDSNEIEEERRIFYVAITRAMKRLYLTSCGGYNFIKNQPMAVSRFIQEINLSNLDTIIKKFQPISTFKDQNDDFFDSQKINVASTMYDFDVNIKVGELIVHKVFGSGVVIGVYGQFIDVKFDEKVGIKTLLKNHRSIVRKLS